MASGGSHRQDVGFPPGLAPALLAAADRVVDEAVVQLTAEHPGTVDATAKVRLQVGGRYAVAELAHRVGGGSGLVHGAEFHAFGRDTRQTEGDITGVITRMRRTNNLAWRLFTELPEVIALPPVQVMALGQLMPAVLDAVTEAVMGGYRSADSEVVDGERAARRRLRGLLFAARPVAVATLGEAAAAAGWPLPDRLVVALAAVPELTAATAPAPTRVLVDREEHRMTLVAPAGEDLEAWLDRTRRALRLRGPIVCGPAVSPEHALESRARAAAVFDRVARELRDADVVYADDHLFDLVLGGDGALAETFAARALAPLAGLDDVVYDRMLETLRAWLDRPDRPQAIADSLFVHVQTVRYRLKQLRGLFGEQLDDPERRVELAIAVRIAARRGRPRT